MFMTFTFGGREVGEVAEGLRDILEER